MNTTQQQRTIETMTPPGVNLFVTFEQIENDYSVSMARKLRRMKRRLLLEQTSQPSSSMSPRQSPSSDSISTIDSNESSSSRDNKGYEKIPLPPYFNARAVNSIAANPIAANSIAAFAA
jgi:hypothetical protein